MPDPVRSEKSIFLHAIEMTSATERAAYLDQACEGNSLLRAEVEALLQAHEAPHRVLDAPEAFTPTTDQVPHPEKPGAVVGPYKLLQQVGEGGMGVVYMAEQEQPVRRKVALKIIKPGMDSCQVIARFEAERQALAMMDHQNIARVLDAGTTEAGRPYFVMELVKGVPITKFCDEQHLTPRERLELFVPVCQAIQHAHQKGIIHRDVKPSNVLVTLYDGKPVPKVIDFGVAKAIEQRLTERTLFTQLGQVVGTLEYMSPEQAELNALDIDTRSDIYSLGVLLYELLTGSTPLEKQKLRGAAFAEMLRVIREEEPPRPSTRLSASGDMLPSISAQRKTEPAKLAKLVRGELDWLVMKALEKDRGRRYETANGFAADVQRYLADEPVQACPPSARYRLGKFVRRHKTGLTIAGLVLCLLVLVGGGAGWLVADRAARHRQAESKLLEALETAEPRLRDGNPGDLALLSAAQQIEAQLGSGAVGPEVRRRAEQLLRDVRLLAELDETRLRRADTKEGEMFDSAGAEARYAAAFAGYGIEVLALDPAEAAARVRSSAIHEALLAGLDDWMQIKQGPLPSPLPWVGGPDSGMPIKPEQERERAYLRRVADAADDNAWRRAFREATLAADKRKLKAVAEQPEALAQPPAALAWLGSVLQDRGLHSEAQALLRQAQQRHPADFWANYHLGRALFLAPSGQQHPEEAVGYCRAAVALRPRSAEAYSLLGAAISWWKKGHDDAAIAAYQQALALDPRFATARINLAAALRQQGDLSGVIRLLQEGIRLNPNDAELHRNLGYYLEVGDPDGAIREYQAALKSAPRYAEVHFSLGIALYGKGQVDEAIACYQKAIELDPKHVPAYYNLGNALSDKGRMDEAIACYRKAIALDPKDSQVHINLGSALLGKGQVDEAIACYQKAIALDPKYAPAHSNLGFVLLGNGQLDEAIACCHKAIDLDPKLAPAHCILGDALSEKGQLDEAIACYHKAIALDPKYAPAHNDLGALLCDVKRDYDGAIACFRRAIVLNPNDANAHSNLGNALVGNGQVDEAIACYQKALDLDPKFAPARSGLAGAERAAAVRDKLPAFQNGSYTPATTKERLGLAGWCQMRKLHRTAVGLYAVAFRADPKVADDLDIGDRFDAACCAAQAAAGQGEDAARLDDKERARLRQQALAWLRADLALRTKQLEGGRPPDRAGMRQALRRWQADSYLAGLRDPAALAKLPAEERQTFTQFWTCVASLLQKAEDRPK